MSADPRISTEAALAVISEQIARTRADLARMERDVGRRLDRIETQTTATNGRVRELERWRIAMEATARAVEQATGWRGRLALGVAVAVGGGVAMLAINLALAASSG